MISRILTDNQILTTDNKNSNQMKKIEELSKLRWKNTTKSLAFASGLIRGVTRTLSRSGVTHRAAGHTSGGETEVKW